MRNSHLPKNEVRSMLKLQLLSPAASCPKMADMNKANSNGDSGLFALLIGSRQQLAQALGRDIDAQDPQVQARLIFGHNSSLSMLDLSCSCQLTAELPLFESSQNMCDSVLFEDHGMTKNPPHHSRKNASVSSLSESRAQSTRFLCSKPIPIQLIFDSYPDRFRCLP
ncbi:hypothetical protein Ciccas_000436 [Cichlidogyrus casuarinus]|uniref:Uncharacterized protein n=1 Tax=Cichlidogyrus casuarinus TaxID=1844966 RepID=A0ABD2QQV8_9PLAT